jgi:hypothetical protein
MDIKICNKCCDVAGSDKSTIIDHEVYLAHYATAFVEWLTRVNAIENAPDVIEDLGVSICIETVTTIHENRSDIDTVIEYCFYSAGLSQGVQQSLEIDPCVRYTLAGTSDDGGSFDNDSYWSALVDEVTLQLDFTYGVAETKSLEIPTHRTNCTLDDFSYMLSSTPAGFIVTVSIDASKNVVVTAEYDGIVAAGTYSNEISAVACGRTQVISPMTYKVV